jgi:hypothetical protein
MQMATLADDVDVSLIHADPEGPRGWRSPYYYSREPAISVDLQTFADSLICWTVFGPQPSHIQQTDATLEIQTDGWRAKVRQGLESNEQDPRIADVTLSGGLRDRLEITSCMSS